MYSRLKDVRIKKDVVLGRPLTKDEERFNKQESGDKFFPFIKPFYKTFNRTKVSVGALGHHYGISLSFKFQLW